MYRVLEVNVDDTGYGGVFSLVKGVIAQKQQGECIDIAAIEKFENQSNIDDLNKYGCKVNYIGFTGNKIFKQFVCFNNLRKLIKKEKTQTKAKRKEKKSTPIRGRISQDVPPDRVRRNNS